MALGASPPAPAARVPLAPGGPHLSAVVAGVWRMDRWGWTPAERLRWVEACADLGVTTFDHADIYGGYTVEALFGEALALAPGLREQLQLVTKCGIRLVSPNRPAHRGKSYDASPAHVVASVEQSLRALRTDRVELLLLHRPDYLMDPGPLAAALERLRADGKVLHVGVSNHRPSQLALLHRHVPVVTNQVELSPLALGALDDGTLDQCLDLGVRPMIWSPLAGGRLFAEGDAAAARARAALARVGAEHGVGVAAAAFAWVLRHPSRPVPVTGSRRVEAVAEAVAALGVELTAEQWYAVWEAGAGREVP